MTMSNQQVIDLANKYGGVLYFGGKERPPGSELHDLEARP